MNRAITIYTDGSSLGNPGAGGWGSLVMSDKSVVELGGSEKDTTNNRMELLAMIKAFEMLAERGITDYDVTLYADSKYVLNGLQSWIKGWKAKGWKKADGKEVLNQDLWVALDGLYEFLQTDNKLFLEHVKAHNGEVFNERVDDIARESAEGKNVELFDGSRKDYLL